jgi:hypothetical protein
VILFLRQQLKAQGNLMAALFDFPFGLMKLCPLVTGSFENGAHINDIKNNPRIVRMMNHMLGRRKLCIDLKPKAHALFKIFGDLKLWTDSVLGVGQIIGLRDQRRFRNRDFIGRD